MGCPPKNLSKSFFYLGSNFKRKSVETLRKITNILQKMVVEDDRRNSNEEARGGGDQCFGDARGYGAQAGGAGISKAGKGVDDAPDRSEKADEGSYGTGGSQPGHSFFDATDFFRGSELHADGDSLEAFQLSSGLRIASADLAQKFAIARGVDRSEWRASGSERLRVGHALGGAEDAKKLIALTADAAKEAEFLKDHGP